jgi:methylated-DNA-[protein]-cysteine S-methyltransferase
LVDTQVSGSLTVLPDPRSLSHMQLPSRFGPLVLLWSDTTAGPRVERLFLPADGELAQQTFRLLKTLGRPRSCPAMRGLAGDIGRFLDGQDLTFPLEILALERCPHFQQRVLRAEHAIPRGWVSTYGRVALQLGVPGGARAVGTALAKNPFPILIPCHRVVRSDGTVGGYRGGNAMKRALLVMEGIGISPKGRVRTQRFYY